MPGVEASRQMTLPPPEEASSSWGKIESHYCRIREIEGSWGSIGVIGIGPARKVTGAVLVPGRAIDQRDAGQLLYHDLLQAVQGLLLQRGISGRSILIQQLIGS